MTSTVSTVSRQVVRRPWTDLDPKVIASALVALAADAVLVALYVAGKIDASVLAAGVGPTAITTVAAYAKASTHGALLVADAERAGALLAEVAPVVAAALPAVAPYVAPVESGVEAITQALAEPERPATAPLLLSATGGGQ